MLTSRSVRLRDGRHARGEGWSARLLKRTLRFVVVGVLAAILGVVSLRLYTIARYRGQMVEPESAPERPVAVVFGAGVLPNGEPTSVLYDRVATAAELYHLGKVERIILSGDGRTEVLNEPDAMRRVALRLGVPDAALIRDGAGLRTYESCVRVRSAFGVTSALLVTQRFHLPRALLVCGAAGIDGIGVVSDGRHYSWRWRLNWEAREVAATVVAWWDAKAPR